METFVEKVDAEDNGIQGIAKAQFDQLSKKETLDDAEKQISVAKIDQKMEKLGLANAPTGQTTLNDKAAANDQPIEKPEDPEAEISVLGALEIPEVAYFEILQTVGYDFNKYGDRDSADIEEYTSQLLRKHHAEKMAASVELAAVLVWLKPAGRVIMARLAKSKPIANVRAKIRTAIQKATGKVEQKTPENQENLGKGGNNGSSLQ